MPKQESRNTMSLFKWIWQSYLRTALIPLFVVELVFIGIYFTANHWSQQEMVAHLEQQVTIELRQIAGKEAAVIRQQLINVSNATAFYCRQMAKALATPAALSAADAGRLAYSPKGVYYTRHDRPEGGAAIFYSGYVPVRERERDKVARVLTAQGLMKDIKACQPLTASIYLNTFDSLNIIYPYFDVLSQYTPQMNIPSYNFYYEADAKHNPQRQIRWTGVYLDPAGHGWMTSAISPVYNGDFLEGVVGIDVTVSTIIDRILKLSLPYRGYGILIGKDGNILALPQKGEADWGLDELTVHHYDEAILKDTFKPDKFNLYKRKSLKNLADKVTARNDGFALAMLKGRSQVVSWATIPETGWKLLLIVPEINVYGQVQRLSRELFQIGALMIVGLVVFYCIFFFILSGKARKMSLSISQPLVEINGIAQRIGDGHYEQAEPDLSVLELRETAGFLVKMGRQLGVANQDLLEVQERLKKREADLQALVNSIDDVILEVDEAGGLINVWSKGNDMLAKAYLDSSITEPGQLFDPETAIMYETALKEVVATATSKSVEYQLETHRGFRWFQARLSLKDLRTRTVVVSARDITNRKEMEQSLVTAKEEAEKANQAKSQFLSSMSHELRTPLNAVLGFAQILEMDPEAPLNVSQGQSVKEILKAGNHLLVLINEVLDLAKIESGKLTLSIEPVQIAPVMAETLALITPMAEKYQVKVHLRNAECQRGFVAGDRTRIKQVLLNLLTNAIKYNNPDGEVTFYCEKKDEMVRFNVLDTGSGIAEADLRSIFKPFHRLSNRERIVEGTGIGLTVAQQLVELMDGRIGVESQLGQGSHFWVEFPWTEMACSLPRVPERTPEEQETNDTGPVRRVLYIEDNPANLSLVERILGHLPQVKMDSAASGELCLDLARAQRPDLILLDINLPGIDGYEVLRRLREDEETRNIPVIALSANAMPRDIEKGKAAGFTDYIVKPIDVPAFLEKIASYFHTLDQEAS